MPHLTSTDGVYTLHLGDDENRVSPSFVAEVMSVLDEVAAADGPRALVTVAAGKFWSNGLDLEWLGAHADQLEEFVASVEAMFAALLRLPVPTIAVLQGHTYAAGAMLALTHDVRLMRSDRGFFCLPEVNINIPFTPGMSALIRSRLAPQVAHEAMTTGRRYGGLEALERQIVDAVGTDDELADAALGRARELAPTAGPTLGAIRSEMYRDCIALLTGGAGGR